MTQSAILELSEKKITHPCFHKALQDIFLGIGMWRIWMLLGWQDIRLRYRRSSLGPFWITLTMAITIYSLGFLYSHLWKTSMDDFILYYATGLLSWTLMVTTVMESSNIFLESRTYLLQMHVPISVFIMRLLVRNFIVFLHNCLAVIPLLIYYHSKLNIHILLIFPALLLVFLCGFTFSMLLAIVGLRFRDIGQLITSLMSLAFFLTPIMWMPSALPKKLHFVIDYNPFAQFVELIRAPLMGQLPSEYAVKAVFFIFITGVLLMLWCLTKVRHRIVYWL